MRNWNPRESIYDRTSPGLAAEAANGRRSSRAMVALFDVGLRLVCMFLLLGITVLPSARAQAVYGSIAGTVVDASGAGMAGAKVTITDLGRNVVHSTETNENGYYNQAHLIIGHYRISVESPGFKTAVAEVDVSVDTVQSVDVTMQPGDIKQQITVSDEAPLLKTERVDVSTTLSQRQVTELPTFGRNFSELLLLTPGTVQFCWGDTSTENPQGGIAVNVNGQMFVGVGSILDGTDNRDFLYGNMLIVPNLDSVVQMKVTSANYDAEFGQVSAAVVSTSTKSGTNEFHGSAFWYRRSGATEARDPFAQAPPNDFIAPTLWSQFGGSIGGPIKKNKLFFFGDYQGTRARDGGSAQAQVPTAAERNGDFSAWLAGANPVVIYNPFNALGQVVAPGSRSPFVSFPSGIDANALCTNVAGCPNMIPTRYISTVSQNLLNYLPLPTNPNAPPGVPNFSGGASDTFHGDAVNVRADYFYSDKLRFFDRYTFTQFLKSAPGLFGGAVGGPQLNPVGYTGVGNTRPQSNSFGFDYTFKPTLITDFRFGWYKQRIDVTPLVTGDFATQAGAVGLNIPSDPTTNNMPHFSIQGPDGFDFGSGLYNNCNCPLIERMQEFQFVNNWTWTKGKHTFKFGPDIRRLQNLRVPSDQHRSGELVFSSGFTEGLSGGTGLGAASFLLGDVSSFQRYVSSSLNAGEREWRTFFYGEDTWRVTSKLTVNYGLRWELYYPQTVTGKGQGGWLDLQTGEMEIAGENGVPLSGPVKTNFKNLAPRLGIAYQINPKTVIRMGYGRSFDVGMFGTIFGHTVTQNLPVLGTQQMNPSNSWDQVFNLAVGPPQVDPANALANQPTGPNGNPLYPNGFRAWVLPFNTHMPTVDAWNATIQRQITPTFSIEAAYVGNKGSHIFVGENNWIDVNAPTTVGFCPGGDTSQPGCLSTDQRRPYFAQFGWNIGLQCMCNPGDNHYNSLQMKAEKRLSHGLSILGNYTYSHAKNHDTPDFLYDPSIEYGRPSWQRNHVISASTIYELPFGRGKQLLHDVPSAVNYVVGGWQLSNVTVWMSGAGVNPFYQECSIDTDSGVCFPNVVGSVHYAHSQSDWFQLTSAPLANNGDTSGPWGRPAFGTFGNAGRNSITGPRWFDDDLSIFKTFPIKEQLQLQFRAEAYNVFNHANLGNPNGCVDCVGTGGGTITSLANNATMRRMQFALRLQF